VLNNFFIIKFDQNKVEISSSTPELSNRPEPVKLLEQFRPKGFLLFKRWKMMDLTTKRNLLQLFAL
jgi:hypothetical protein